MSLRVRRLSIVSALLFILFITAFQDIHSVSAQVQSTYHLGNEFQRFNISEFDLKLKEPNIEDRMMCKRWCGNEIITMMDTLEVQFNFDLEEDLFYINMNDKIFTVKSDFIKSFIIDDQVYINYRKPYTTKAMILELMVEGKYTLYKHHNLLYKEPDFNPVLNVGSKVGSYKMKFDYYAFCNERLIDIPGRAKKALKELQQECEVPKTIKAKGDLIDMFEKINSLD